MKHYLFLLLFVFFLRAAAQESHFDQTISFDEMILDSVEKTVVDTMLFSKNFIFNKDNQTFTTSIVDQKWEILPDSFIVFLENKLLTYSVIPSVVQWGSGGDDVVEVVIPRYRISENHKAEQLKSFVLRRSVCSSEKSVLSSAFASQSVLKSGSWVKVSVNNRGICKITYTQLKDMGIASPANVAVYGNGGYMLPKLNSMAVSDDLVKNRVLHAKDASGNDCIFFYSSGTTSWNYDAPSDFFDHSINLYSEKQYFYLTSDLDASVAPEKKASLIDAPDQIIDSYDFLAFEENENINFLQSGRIWYQDKLNNGYSKTYTFGVINPDSGSDSKIKVTAAARSDVASSMKVMINDQLSGKLGFSSTDIVYTYADHAKVDSKIFPFKSTSNAKVYLSYSSTSENESAAWLDYITLNTKAQLKFDANPLLFRDRRSLFNATIGYQISGVDKSSIIWDVTNPLLPNEIVPTESGQANFIVSGGQIGEYVVFNPLMGSFLNPSMVSSIVNQNIHGAALPQMVIVTHPDFLTASEDLAEFHRIHDSLSVLVVTTQQVYNEFSSGLPDVAAIRNMMRMFYVRSKNSSKPTRFLLLMGDGSYDNRNFDGPKMNLIPTYQSLNSLSPLSSFVTDDFFGLLDENEGEYTGALDLGIGRIPCKTAFEAQVVVNKIKNYVEPVAMGAWRNQICFIADDEDKNVFMRDTDSLIALVESKYSGFYTDKIYLDAYQQKRNADGDFYPDVNEAITRKVKEGALIVNYVGHANDEGLAHEKVVMSSDINSWSNTTRLPIFVTATCEFSSYDNDQVSAGEYVLLNPIGGGIGLFTTTRVVYSGSNYVLSRNFYKYVFEHDEQGENLRMGDIIRLAKVATTNDTNKLNFTLLADPALKLAFPKYEIKTLSIQGKNPQVENIQIGALEKVTITGEVVDLQGNRVVDFSGVLTPSIYDKEVQIQTLANDGGTPYNFNSRENLIYKGNSSVKNGYFEFSFIVPKDITYSVGSGKIYYYVQNDSEDGNGSIDRFDIGGTSSQAVSDQVAPQIDLYLNNEQFESGDHVNASTLLLVKLFDESGINTVGAGIGHDLVAILDDDYSNPIVLNDYYSSNVDDFQRGSILYPLTNLSEGKHTLRIKIWDVYNNSAEAEIQFVVDSGFKILSVKNAPTFVDDQTTFIIEHNLPGETFDVTFEFYNTAGRKLGVLEDVVVADYSGKLSVTWQPDTDTYRGSASPVVVYQVIMRNVEQYKAIGTGKLLFKIKKN